MIIDTIENEPLKGDVLAAMSILSSEKYSSELVKKYARREMLMNSPLFEEWVKEERKEATMKATITTIREKIIDVLTERFEFVPDNIIDELNSIESIMTLNQLFTKSIKVASLDEFSKLLKVITQY